MLQLPFDRSSLMHWRQRLGEEQLVALIQESLSVAHKTGALATGDPRRRRREFPLTAAGKARFRRVENGPNRCGKVSIGVRRRAEFASKNRLKNFALARREAA